MVQYSRNVTKAFFVFILVSIGINGCKDDYTSVIPYVYVDYSIIPPIELNVPGGSIFIKNQGYGGIIIFRDMTVDGSIKYLTYDATCTYEMLPNIKVVADGSGTATCPECKSQYILFGGDGSAISGPSAEPLKQYRTYFSGGRIVIKN